MLVPPFLNNNNNNGAPNFYWQATQITSGPVVRQVWVKI